MENPTELAAWSGSCLPGSDWHCTLKVKSTVLQKCAEVSKFILSEIQKEHQRQFAGVEILPIAILNSNTQFLYWLGERTEFTSSSAD